MTVSIETLNADALALLRRHNILRTLVERQVVDEAVEQAILSEEEQTQARLCFIRGGHHVKTQDALSSVAQQYVGQVFHCHDAT